MKFNWLSNAPWSNTGYGNQTRTFVPRLKAAGHDPAITAFYGLEGGILHWDGIPVYPKAYDIWGNDIAASHTRWHEGRVLISLIDAWVLNADMLQLHGVRWIPWFPIDTEPPSAAVIRAIRKAYRRLVFSKYAQRQIEAFDLECTYIPHGVDTGIYKPHDQLDAREKLGLPNDRFIIGMVAANKGWPCRKAFPEAIAAFAQFKKQRPDALLYLHAAKAEQNQNQGINLPELCALHGLVEGVDYRFPDQYRMMIGYEDRYMAALYSAFDVLLSPSYGEGFGIPIIEAQACGCPVIVGDWTAMSELCLSGWKIPKAEAIPLYIPQAAYQYIPNSDAIADRLEAAYNSGGSKRAAAAKRARVYDADRIVQKHWLPFLAEVEEAVGSWQE